MKAQNIISYFFIAALLLCFGLTAVAAAPSGNHWFQIIAQTYTGSDATGDGGTGDASDFNYYYVGQTFRGTVQIKSTGTTAANIKLTYPTAYLTISNLLAGSYFTEYPSTGQATSSGIVRLTGTRMSGVSSATGTFGYVDFVMGTSSACNYSTTSYQTLSFTTSSDGLGDVSSIAYQGINYLDSKEDFNFHIWADLKNPFATGTNITNTSSSVPVELSYIFALRDTKNGSSSNTGVGTGINTAAGGRTLTFNDGTGATSYLAYASYSCSGTWNTNCTTTVNPDSPLAITGDTRNWKYNTSYTINVSGYTDRASTAQANASCPGEANGPNSMDASTWTFTTEADTIAPSVSSTSPAAGASGVATTSNVVVEIIDIKAANISGEGVSSTSCQIDLNVPSWGGTWISFNSATSTVTVTPINYGYRYTIDPSSNFAQNETVSARIRNCYDLANNVSSTDPLLSWTFATADNDPPYVTPVNPVDKQSIVDTAAIVFNLRDLGVGVSLANTFIYVDGLWWSNAGGSGTIATSGTSIAFATSNNFNGGNYAGDTSGISAIANGYTFTLKKQGAFTTGSVPIEVFSRDTSNNLMHRYLYGAVAGTATCASSTCYDNNCCSSGTTWNGLTCTATLGSAYCGSNTSWNGSLCIGSASSGGMSAGGGGGLPGKDYCGSNTRWDGRKCIASSTAAVAKCTPTTQTKFIEIPKEITKYISIPKIEYRFVERAAEEQKVEPINRRLLENLLAILSVADRTPQDGKNDLQDIKIVEIPQVGETIRVTGKAQPGQKLKIIVK